MTKEIEFCPFCGSRCVTLLNGGPGNYFVRCDDCLAASNDVQKEHAVELWNARAQPQSPSDDDVADAHKHVMQAIKDLREAGVTIPMSLHHAAHALHYATVSRPLREGK